MFPSSAAATPPTTSPREITLEKRGGYAENGAGSRRAPSSTAGALLLWSFLYSALTNTVLGLAVQALPLLKRWRPKLAKWIAMRYYPRPLRLQPQLWLHAVSVGEIQIAQTLLQRLNQSDFLLTTTTQAAYQLLRQRYGTERVRYLPWDVERCYRRLFGSYRVPPLLVVETEIWPVLFRFVRQSGAPLAIVNGRMSARSLRLRNNPLFRATLQRASLVLARGESDRASFTAFGLPAERVIAVGNIKFDVQPRELETGPLRDWLADPAPLLLFASISADEVDDLAAELIRLLDQRPDLRALWVPRHLETLEQHLAALAPLQPAKRSALQPDQRPRLLVLDSFGELSGCYAFARLSLVGGSFNQRGGQNFLEALKAGSPVLVGPYTENFREETDEALAAGALIRLDAPDQLASTVSSLLADPERITDMQRRAASFLERHGGAIARTCQALRDHSIS